jgi:Transposase, Mutator family
VNVACVVATGVGADGHREVLGVEVFTGEDYPDNGQPATNAPIQRVDLLSHGQCELRRFPIAHPTAFPAPTRTEDDAPVKRLAGVVASPC